MAGFKSFDSAKLLHIQQMHLTLQKRKYMVFILQPHLFQVKRRKGYSGYPLPHVARDIRRQIVGRSRCAMVMRLSATRCS